MTIETEDVFRNSDLVLPFLLRVDGGIMNITEGTLTAEIWWRNRLRMTLSSGNGGLQILNLFPNEADEEEEQEPHGNVLLSEEQTATLPLGAIALLRFKYIAPGAVTAIAEACWLDCHP